MANTASPEWLKEELTKALGWDAMFMEGVVQAICDASSKAELQDLIEVGIVVLSPVCYKWIVAHRMCCCIEAL
jgi:hypothetical protein